VAELPQKPRGDQHSENKKVEEKLAPPAGQQKVEDAGQDQGDSRLAGEIGQRDYPREESNAGRRGRRVTAVATEEKRKKGEGKEERIAEWIIRQRKNEGVSSYEKNVEEGIYSSLPNVLAIKGIAEQEGREKEPDVDCFKKEDVLGEGRVQPPDPGEDVRINKGVLSLRRGRGETNDVIAFPFTEGLGDHGIYAVVMKEADDVFIDSPQIHGAKGQREEHGQGQGGARCWVLGARCWVLGSSPAPAYFLLVPFTFHLSPFPFLLVPFTSIELPDIGTLM